MHSGALSGAQLKPMTELVCPQRGLVGGREGGAWPPTAAEPPAGHRRADPRPGRADEAAGHGGPRAAGLPGADSPWGSAGRATAEEEAGLSSPHPAHPRPPLPFAPPARAAGRGPLRALDAGAGEEAAGEEAAGAEPGGRSPPPPAAPAAAPRGSSCPQPARRPRLHRPFARRPPSCKTLPHWCEPKRVT